jgi:hypothetical protein
MILFRNKGEVQTLNANYLRGGMQYQSVYLSELTLITNKKIESMEE